MRGLSFRVSFPIQGMVVSVTGKVSIPEKRDSDENWTNKSSTFGQSFIRIWFGHVWTIRFEKHRGINLALKRFQRESKGPPPRDLCAKPPGGQVWWAAAAAVMLVKKQ
jgi:hypothetical protein